MLLKKILRGITLVILYLILLTIVNFVHMRYFKVDVVFYSALLDCMIALILLTLTVFAFKITAIFSSFELIQLFFSCLLLGYILAISVPTVIDRSLSFYILEKLEQSGTGIARDDFEYVFTQGYSAEHKLVDVRLTEQVQSGTISIKNGCVALTNKGRVLADFSVWYRENMLPRQRLLAGKYTDVLIDPLAAGFSVDKFKCVQQ